MKNLFILRHPEATLPTPQVKDKLRPLTAKGQDDAALLGAYWHKQGIHFDKVVASPATRTEQTVYAVVAPLGYPSQAISFIEPLYEGDIDIVRELIHAWNNTWQRVLLVSHQPVIQALHTYLTNEPAPSLLPGNYVHLQLKLECWRTIGAGIGKLVATGCPQDLQNSML